jgi:hypothetical protein
MSFVGSGIRRKSQIVTERMTRNAKKSFRTLVLVLGQANRVEYDALCDVILDHLSIMSLPAGTVRLRRRRRDAGNHALFRRAPLLEEPPRRQVATKGMGDSTMHISSWPSALKQLNFFTRCNMHKV